ncbi:MAG: UDP-N-acetylmuramoyl-L-alanine--D-glutamate ligase [Candidatus Woesebacteria bacterium]
MNRNKLPSWLQYPRSIAIVGFGREGQSTYRFLRKYHPDIKIRILDENEKLNIQEDVTSEEIGMDPDLLVQLRHDPKLELRLGHESFSDLQLQDVIFKTPGIPNHKLKLPEKTYLTSQADLFVQMFGKQTIAVTGTKGKSTTAHVMEQMLQKLRYPTALVGNIGVPALDITDDLQPETTVIFEMSAFQTESLHVAPHIGVFTSLYKDHLDYYENFETYSKAKLHLFLLQKPDDICIFRSDDAQLGILLSSVRSKKYTYGANSANDTTVFLQDGWLVYKTEPGTEERIIHTQNIPLAGEHMIINCMPALILLREGLSSSGWKPVATRDLEQALSSLTALPGRLEKVDTVNRIRFYDDALATIPEATIAALDALQDDVVALIAGGHDRGQVFDALAKRIVDSKIRILILFPSTGSRLKEAIQKLTDVISCVEVTSMSEAITTADSFIRKLRTAKQPISKFPIVLLSTAAPSFGLFADYTDRSRQYKNAINTLRQG